MVAAWTCLQKRSNIRNSQGRSLTPLLVLNFFVATVIVCCSAFLSRLPSILCSPFIVYFFHLLCFFQVLALVAWLQRCPLLWRFFEKMLAPRLSSPGSDILYKQDVGWHRLGRCYFLSNLVAWFDVWLLRFRLNSVQLNQWKSVLCVF